PRRQRAAHVRHRGAARRRGGAGAAGAPGLVPGRRGARAVGGGRGRPARARHHQLRAVEARSAPAHAGPAAVLRSDMVLDVQSHVYEPAAVWEGFLDREYRVAARSAFWHDVDAHGVETTLLNGGPVRSLRRGGINRHACWHPGMTPESIGALDPDVRHATTPGASDPVARL